MRFIDRTLIRNSTILAVNDSPVLLDALDISVGELCKEFVVASCFEQAMQLIIEKIPNLILLDIDMLSINDFDFFEKLKEMIAIAKIPVIFLLSAEDKKMKIKVLEIGAADYVTKPFDRTILLHRINTQLNISYYCEKLATSMQSIENELVRAFSTLLESRDKNANGHAIRTSRYLKILGQKMIDLGIYIQDLDNNILQKMVYAAPLHDIGKIGVPDSVFLHPKTFTKKEFDVMKTHTSRGAKILDTLYRRVPSQYYLLFAGQMALNHHEYFNGSGYPNGISGGDIPLCARMMAVADVYDALTQNRIHRKAMSHEKACEIILKENEVHFDPALIDVFVEVKNEFKVISDGKETSVD